MESGVGEGTVGLDVFLPFLALQCPEGLGVPVEAGGAGALVVPLVLPLGAAPGMKVAMAGPGKGYFSLLSKAFLSKMPGSPSLYAPGSDTKSDVLGWPVWDPPTLTWAQPA